MSEKVLVIVESSAKAKTIGKFLGKNYKVKASVGHVRDLPKSKLGVDVNDGFTPQYITIRGKGELIKEIREESNKADRILLATDPDREGEAIAWHLSKVINQPERTRRVEFNEITKDAVTKAIKKPRMIDQNRVDAQQARRILDRLVGYNLSPLLWAKIRKGLSAGRVQSVAVRLICEREKEIDSFVAEEYWSIEVVFKSGKKASFTAKLHSVDGSKAIIGDKATADKIVQRIKKASFKIVKIDKKEKRRKAVAPFTTSTLQQEASRKLGYTSTRTMRIAQELYEGLNIGAQGTVGLVTYIRTDSTRVASEAQEEAKEFITQNFGADYYPGTPNVYKSRKSAQDAHEAIRPSSVYRTPQSLKDVLTRDQHRLYNLIWTRFVASQMSSAVYDTVTIDIADKGLLLRASSSVLRFPGHLSVYEETNDEEKEKGKLPELNEGDLLSAQEVLPEQHFTQPPPRYTEASLVKMLEEKNIGRPSTYAPIIETIIKRGYVERKNKQFEPTELGIVVVDLLKEHFPEVMDVDFTASMEGNLDQIEEGDMAWQKTIEDFYSPFSYRLEKAKDLIEKVKIADEPAGRECPKCGRQMVIKMGRFGKFAACPGFPECRHTESINEVVGVPCPQCGSDLVALRTKKGRRFYGCKNYPDCDFKSWNKPGDKVEDAKDQDDQEPAKTKKKSTAKKA